MAVTGISDGMIQHWRTTEEIVNKKPKNPKPYGLKRPDSSNIIVVLAGLFVIVVAISQM